MFPAIFISCAASVLASVIESETWGAILLSAIKELSAKVKALESA